MGPEAHDPISIAALIAALPELEAAYLEARQKSDEANKALDVIQMRIDAAMTQLRVKASHTQLANMKAYPLDNVGWAQNGGPDSNVLQSSSCNQGHSAGISPAANPVRRKFL